MTTPRVPLTNPTNRKALDMTDASTRQAVAAITAALHEGRDVAEFLAQSLCYVAAAEGGIEEVLRNRSGSWEAGHLRNLMEGTVGPDGEHLDGYREASNHS